MDALRRTIRRIGAISTPQGTAVAGAFEEINLAYHRVLEQIFVTKHQGLSHQAIDDELMLRRVDVRHPGMMALKMQAVRGDGALQVLQRGA